VIVHSWLDLRSVLDDACVLVIVHSWLDLRSVLDDACVLVIVHSWFEDVTKNGQSQGHMHHRAQNEAVTKNGQVLNGTCGLVIVHSWLHLHSVLNGTCGLVIVHSWHLWFSLTFIKIIFSLK
jgi:hypothetical protein